MVGNPYRDNDSFPVSNFNVKIFIIGYGSQGESVVVLFLDGAIVFYSIVIDSYQLKSKKKPAINKTMDILRDYGVSRLDILCWTHPHRDHSKGITSIINKYCDTETLFIYPPFVLGDHSQDFDIKGDERTAAKNVLDENRLRKVNANQVSVLPNNTIPIDKFKIRDVYMYDDRKIVEIFAISPVSRELLKDIGRGKKKNPNELSVCLVINISDYFFYFGGDTTNNQINSSDKYTMNKCRFVKIPHHGSKTAEALLDYLPNNIDAACTTLYYIGSAHDPEQSVIDGYKGKVQDVYATGSWNRKSDALSYRMMIYDYDFSGVKPKLSTEKKYCPVML